MIAMKSTNVLLALSMCIPACSSDDSKGSADATFEQEVVSGMHDALLTDVQALHTAAVDLQTAAPTPSGRGWDKIQDAAAISAMTKAWLSARASYERTEGALAPLFP